MQRTTVAALLLIALILWAAPARAQFETSSLLGTIRDNSGAVVSGATVTITNTETGVSQTRTTDGNGNYEFFTSASARTS